MTLGLDQRWRHHPTASFVSGLMRSGGRFLITGGWAVAHYCPSRVPDDVDLLAEASRPAFDAVCSALRQVDANLRVPEVGSWGMRRHLPLPPPLYGDILTPWEDEDYDALWEARVQARWTVHPIWVVGWLDLVRQKERAIARTQDATKREKDQSDLALLRNLAA